MFFDREESYQRSKQIAYRNQLKNQIQFKNSKVFNKNLKNETNSNQKQETFSLVANIQIAAQARKNKQNQYYVELRNQIQKQKQQKKRMKQEKARKQREQQQKIRKDNQLLKQRYQQQIKKQGRKKGQLDNNINNNFTQKQSRNQNKGLLQKSHIQQSNTPQKQTNFRRKNLVKLQNLNQRLNTAQSQEEQNNFSSHNVDFKKGSVPYIHTYINRIQNQTYNYLPQRRHMNSYFSQLLGQRKMLQQETSGIAELNKMFFQQKVRAGRIQSRGLQQLRNLQSLLEQKGVNYMQSSYNKNIINGSRSRNSATNF